MNSREKAYVILIDVCLHGKFSNLALKNELRGFDLKDRALISNLVYGTLKNSRYLKYNWECYCKKGPVKPEIEILLNMGAYQLLLLDKLPNYAVVNEMVEIAKHKYDGKFTSFVNAVLRQIIRNGKRPVTGNDSERLAIETSFPIWIIKMWNKQYGEEITKKICDDSLGNADFSVRVNPRKTTKKELLETGYFIDGKLNDDALICKAGHLPNTELYTHGKITIQDEASMLPAKMLDPKPGEKVLDMCSAPGSKTAQLSLMMKNKGTITALDLHEHRVELVRSNMLRLGCINVDSKVMDATKALEVYGEESFDRILLDAPCSGYGVLKRKADIKYHMNPEEMDGLIKIQKELLDTAGKLLKRDGVLVYSTCTLNKKENELQIKNFLEADPRFELAEEKIIFPFEYGTDGFFMAKLIKIS